MEFVTWGVELLSSLSWVSLSRATRIAVKNEPPVDPVSLLIMPKAFPVTENPIPPGAVLPNMVPLFVTESVGPEAPSMLTVPEGSDVPDAELLPINLDAPEYRESTTFP